MSVKKNALLFAFAALLVACVGGVDLSEKGSDGARGAAEYFYSLLSDGDGGAYVQNMQEAHEVDSCMHVQFVALMDQFLYEEKNLRGGILSAKASGDL